ncbi:MAG TPA: CmcJ/NvfI family oxidoreductase [Caulobacteraceae bacterium]
MSMTQTRPAEAKAEAFVEAVIRFTDPASAGAVLHTDDHDSSTFQLIPKTVRITNARTAAEPLSFEANGFTLVDAPVEIDFLDRTQVEQRYYPEAQRIVRELTGASEVIAFLDLVRSEVREEGIEPANNAHIDFDGSSIEAWVRALRPDDAERLLAKRMVNMNLWRPIRPVERMPLAICDASSVSRADLVRTIIGHKEGDQKTPYAGFNLAYNPDQRWFYYPAMQPNEVLAFKIYDSEMQRPHLTAHTAFVDPTSRPGAPTRLSHEIRTIAFFD